MKNLVFILFFSFLFNGFSQEIVEEEIAPAILTISERAPESITETLHIPLSEEVIENEINIITTSVYKNFRVVKTEPKQ